MIIYFAVLIPLLVVSSYLFFKTKTGLSKVDKLFNMITFFFIALIGIGGILNPPPSSGADAGFYPVILTIVVILLLLIILLLMSFIKYLFLKIIKGNNFRKINHKD
jgi:hypothetical protein